MATNKKVAFHTFGCKLNFSETSTISRLFEDAGMAIVGLDAQPDIFVVNTCSVTENANKECRRVIRKAKNTNPQREMLGHHHRSHHPYPRRHYNKKTNKKKKKNKQRKKKKNKIKK